MKKALKTSKEKELHKTCPPRLEGVVKNANMNPKRKRKKSNVSDINWPVNLTF